MQKAQFWSFDVIFAMIIFSFAITVLAYTWFNLSSELAIGYGNGSGIMQLQLKSLSRSLLSEGYPGNWQSIENSTDSATWAGLSVGLANADGSYSLSPDKVYALASMSNSNYEATKEALGTGFDYYIRISGDPQASGMNISIGRNPLGGAPLTEYVSREYATMSGAPVSVTIILWTNTTIATT
ncbi:MAG: hypothetical protein KGI06_00975 [Candidatus Micrarchaeota archaeon]|nr:hypothetical protein [Candidatus Micrarchaeota archaeon]